MVAIEKLVRICGSRKDRRLQLDHMIFYTISKHRRWGEVESLQTGKRKPIAGFTFYEGKIRPKGVIIK